MKKPNGTNRRPKAWQWPPDVFWISPDGAVIEVIGHLTALQAHPETYGFSYAPRTRAEIDKAFHEMFDAGWVRGRFSGGVLHTQMERPRGTSLGNVFDLILKFREHVQSVDVDFANPAYAKMSRELLVAEFMDQKFPGSWGLNPPRRRN